MVAIWSSAQITFLLGYVYEHVVNMTIFMYFYGI